MTFAVSIGPRDRGGFGLAMKMRVEDKNLPQAELASFVHEAHEKIVPIRMQHAAMEASLSSSSAARNKGRGTGVTKTRPGRGQICLGTTKFTAAIKVQQWKWHSIGA